MWSTTFVPPVGGTRFTGHSKYSQMSLRPWLVWLGWSLLCTPSLVVGQWNETTVDVAFPANNETDFLLEGTLRLPASPNSNESVPGVVFFHGNGAVSRNSNLEGQLSLFFGFEIPVFASIAEVLQDNGFAVLTYDKRTCGVFNGCSLENNYPIPTSDQVGVDQYLQDADAALQYLQSRMEVDRNRITILGHNQGGSFIPILLQRYPELRNGILLATPISPIDTILEYQYNFSYQVLLTLGLTEDEANSNPDVIAFNETVQNLKELRVVGNYNDTSVEIGGAPGTFWETWFDISEQAKTAASQMTQPILIINGLMDWTIPVEEAYAWEDHITTTGVGGSTVVQVVTPDCITHAMNCVNESNLLLITAQNISNDVSPVVLDAILEFVQEPPPTPTWVMVSQPPVSAPTMSTTTSPDGGGGFAPTTTMMTPESSPSSSSSTNGMGSPTLTPAPPSSSSATPPTPAAPDGTTSSSSSIHGSAPWKATATVMMVISWVAFHGMV